MAIRMRAPALPPALIRRTCVFRGLAAPALALAGASCTASVTSAPPPPIINAGAAIMDWTIQGMKDPAQCQATGAATFHVALYGSGGAFAGEYVQDCAAFATTIGGLVPDTYTGSADLLDSSGRPRTTAVNLAPFGIVEAASVTVALDFPANSFF